MVLSGRRYSLARDSLADELVKQPCQFCGSNRCNCGHDIGVLLQRRSNSGIGFAELLRALLLLSVLLLCALIAAAVACLAVAPLAAAACFAVACLAAGTVQVHLIAGERLCICSILLQL